MKKEQAISELENASNQNKASKIEKDPTLKCQDMVIDICKRLNADTYINAIGGTSLYDAKTFNQNGLDLAFLEMDKFVSQNQPYAGTRPKEK